MSKGTVIMPCNCKDDQQDAMYGKGMRVHNISGTEDIAFCTVCSPSTQRTRKFKEPRPSKQGKPFKRTKTS